MRPVPFSFSYVVQRWLAAVAPISFYLFLPFSADSLETVGRHRPVPIGCYPWPEGERVAGEREGDEMERKREGDVAW